MSDDWPPDWNPDPDGTHLAAALGDQAALDQRATVASLAAAERVIDEGRFNIAKLLRAEAHSSRVRALELERMAAAGMPSSDRLPGSASTSTKRLRARPARARSGTGR